MLLSARALDVSIAIMVAKTAISVAKQQLRKKLRESLAAMSDQQRKEESEKLVKKVVLADR